MCKKVCFLLISMVFFVLASTPVLYAGKATGVKIGVIDMQKVVKHSKAGKKVMEKLNKKFEQLQKELRADQDNIKAFKEDLEKKAPLLSEEAKAEKERQYKKMLRDFKQKSDDAQFEMRKAESRNMAPILKQLEKIVTKMAKDRHYTIILEKNMPGLYYVAPNAELTEDVVKAYDRVSAASSAKQDKKGK